MLSKFLGCWHPDFMGGEQVQALEQEWAAYFGVKHAIAVNSNTSGLYCAVGATNVEPGEEIIVSPYTMAASATAPLIYNAIPIFADIEREHFCLDPSEIEKKITPRTRAIIVVDIFGQPYAADEINRIAKKHNLIVIEDCAQAPGAKYKGKFAGALGDIGVYSLNYHKHIHSGEGGMIVTNDDKLADRMRLIRNHAEAVVEDKGETNLVNMLGYNYRMTELEAAIARCQLRKLDYLFRERQDRVNYLCNKLAEIPCINVPKVREGATHAYYGLPFKFEAEVAGVSREKFIQAVKAELAPTELRSDDGVQIGIGYVRPLYLAPLFQKKIAFGSKGFPFTLHPGPLSYEKGLCPVAEEMHFQKIFTTELMRPPMTMGDMDDVVRAFSKVWEARKSI